MTERKKLLRAAARRLGSRAGESIAETLVAVLIAALAIVMLASMILSSTDVVQRSRQTFSRYYAENSELETHTSSADTAKTAGTVRLTDASTGITVQLIPSMDSVSVDCYTNGTAAAYDYNP